MKRYDPSGDEYFRALARERTVVGDLLPKVACPLLGGNQRHRFTGAMEQAVDDAMDETDEKNEHMPEVVFLTDDELT